MTTSYPSKYSQELEEIHRIEVQYLITDVSHRPLIKSFAIQTYDISEFCS